MATMAAIVARVRTRLEEAAAAAWTDAEIEEGITETLAAYNTRYQLEATATATVAAAARTSNAPAGLYQLVRVVEASGAVIPARGAPEGYTADERQCWEVFAGVIRFTQPLDAQDLTLWYTKSHLVTEVVDADVHLLVLGGYWRALLGRAVQLMKRGDDGGAARALAIDAQAEYREAWDRRGRRMRVGAMQRE